MEFDFRADEKFTKRMLQWLRQFPRDFQTVEVTICKGCEVIGRRVWRVSKSGNLSDVAREIVEYSHGFPAGARGTMKPAC